MSFQSFQQLENGLTRARELIAVNKSEDALNVLQSMVTTRRYRSVTTIDPHIEGIMLLYLELCVEMRRGRLARDGLMQFRSACSSSNQIPTLGKAINHLLTLADAKARVAQEKSSQIVADIEDLDAEESAELVVVSAIAGEDSKERTDREVVAPWLKFLWESYRTALDVLRNNSRLEKIYQETAKRAFQFALEYKRATEFRRLCEILRNHLVYLGKQANNADKTNYLALTSTKSIMLQLGTRFEQLEVAIKMELWQEVFRTVEDIHNLLLMCDTPPEVIADAKDGSAEEELAKYVALHQKYYSALTRVFWVSQSFLFHAHAWHRFFQASKATDQGLSADEFRLRASSVVIAAICVKLDDQLTNEPLQTQSERFTRMSSLLSINPHGGQPIPVPQMHELAEGVDAAAKKLQHAVFPELKDLYQLVVVDFQHPLQLCKKMGPILDFVKGNENLARFHEPLQRVVVYRSIEQLSQVYQTITLANLFKIIDFVPPAELEKLIVHASKGTSVPIRIDHRDGVLRFPQRSLNRSNLQHQLTTLADKLRAAQALIDEAQADARKEERAAVFAKIAKGLASEHKRMYSRKYVVETRKEEREKRKAESLRLRRERLAQRKAAKRQAEEERLAREAAKIEARRAEEDRKAMERQQMQTLIEEFEKSTGKKLDVKKEFGDIEGEELRAALHLKREELADKERNDLQRKIKRLEQTLDFTERAKRKVEQPKIDAAYEKQREQDKISFYEQQEDAAKAHRKAHEKDLETKARLSAFKSIADGFYDEIMADRERVANEKLKSEQAQRQSLKERRTAEVKESRRRERQRRKEEERRRRRQALLEERRRKEEEERRQAEEERLAKIAAEKEEARAAADRQRQRELEAERRAEERERQRQSERPGARPRDDGPPRLGERFDDRGPPRRGDGPPPRRGDGPPRRYDDGPRREPRRSDGPPRGGDEPPRFGERFDDRGRDAPVPRRGDAPVPRRGDAPVPRRGEGPPPQGGRYQPPRGGDGGGDWRSGAPPRRQVDDDGFTRVGRGGRR